MCRFLKTFFNQPKPDPREVIMFDLRDYIPKIPLGYSDLTLAGADRVQAGLVTALKDAKTKNAIVEVDLDVIDDGYSSFFLHRLFASLPGNAGMTPREVIYGLRLVSSESPSYVMESLDYILNDRWRNSPRPSL